MSAPYPAADSHGPHETDSHRDAPRDASTSAAVDQLISDTNGHRRNSSARRHRDEDGGDDHLEQTKRERERERETSRERHDRERLRRNRDLELGKEQRRISGVSSVSSSHKLANDADGDVDMRSPRSDYASANGTYRSRRRSRSRDSDRYNRSRRDRERERERDRDHDRGVADRRRERYDDYRRSSRGGDYFRGSRYRSKSRSRSRSPYSHSHYRPTSRSRRDSRDRGDRRSSRQHHHRRRSPSPRRRSRTPPNEPPESEDERDRRTIFVQQLAARLRTKELIAFCEKVGPVKEAQIVKDRVSGRSKGVGYVEFENEESVPLAIQLTGQKLLGIPIIAQFTEAEKNRQAKTASVPPEVGEAPQQPRSGPAPFHRLYVGNIHFSINENDIQTIFEPFGELDFVQLQRDEQNRSRGYGFVQFRDPNQAREALEKMNGFNLAGRPIRVGLGNDKSADSRSQGQSRRPTGTYDRSGSGGLNGTSGAPGVVAANSIGTGGGGGGSSREEKVASGASALDDTDVAGVNFNNFSRDALMRKLARADESPTSAISPGTGVGPGSTVSVGAASSLPNMKTGTDAKPLPVHVNMASRCVLLRNMFDPSEEEGENWVKELEDEVRAECEEKYGHVVHIAVDPNTQGDIYMKFDRVTGGENAIKSLNGRFFGGRQISAQPVVDAVYRSLFSKAAI